MKFLKSFESMFKVDSSELELEYENFHCNNCNSDFVAYKPFSMVCKFCYSKDIYISNKTIELHKYESNKG